MKRTHFGFLPLLGLGFMLGPCPIHAADTRQMNILMIVVEDWSAFAVGCYGNPIVRTPAVDRLAAGGIRFDRAYCSSALCNPSRSSLVTGLRPDTARVYGNGDSMDAVVPEGAPSMAGMLGGQPETFVGQMGKLVHMWADAERFAKGFDLIEYTHDYDRPERFDGVLRHCPAPPDSPGHPELECGYLPDRAVARRLLTLRAERDEKIAAGVPNTWELRKPFQQLFAEQIGDSGLDEEEMEDGRLARSAVRLLSQLAREDRRFFLTVGLYATHTPLLAPRKYVEMYDPREMPLTRAPRTGDRGVPDIARRNGQNYDIFNGMYPEYKPTPERQREAIAAYYACASYIDTQIGLILEALEREGLAEETAVLFFSDHGFQLGEHGCWSKFTLFEQSTRVPLIVRVPGRPGNGSVCDEIVELVDVLPTLCDLWGIEPSPQFEGLSFAPLLEDPRRAWKRAAFSTIPLGGLGRSVRTRQYKYAEYHRTREWPASGEPLARELYDLSRDPWEQRNLADEPEWAPTRKELAELLQSGWRGALPGSPRP